MENLALATILCPRLSKPPNLCWKLFFHLHVLLWIILDTFPTFQNRHISWSFCQTNHDFRQKGQGQVCRGQGHSVWGQGHRGRSSPCHGDETCIRTEQSTTRPGQAVCHTVFTSCPPDRQSITPTHGAPCYDMCSVRKQCSCQGPLLCY